MKAWKDIFVTDELCEVVLAEAMLSPEHVTTDPVFLDFCFSSLASYLLFSGKIVTLTLTTKGAPLRCKF